MWKKYTDTERSPEQESQRMVKIKTIVTVVVIVIIAAIALKNWDSRGGYIFEISTDEGYAWTCTVSDESIAKIAEEKTEDGKYFCRIEGVEPGDVEVTLIRKKTENPVSMAEKRVYQLKVAEDNLIMQKGVSRKLYE